MTQAGGTKLYFTDIQLHTQNTNLFYHKKCSSALFSLLPKGDQSLHKCKTNLQIILWDYTGSQPLVPQGLRQEGYMGCQSTPRKNLLELPDLPEPSGNLSQCLPLYHRVQCSVMYHGYCKDNRNGIKMTWYK